ncbi:MAG TPA: hypothetical protein VGF86_14745 [Candidatus Tumulicola sp.]
MLSGVLNPEGQCTDDAGNVYIADTGDGNVLEYAHGGTMPIRVLDDPGEYPVGCSVNPGNGDVAASDIFSPTTGEGAVTVWKPAETQGTTYVEPDGILECFFIAYDGSGNLYVNGFDSSGPALAYPRAGSSTWETATIKGVQFDFPWDMQWDGRYLAFAGTESDFGTVYRMRFHGRFGRVAETVQFAAYIGELDIFGPKGRRKLATMNSASPQVAVYRYPAGGSAVKTIALPDIDSSRNSKDSFGRIGRLGPTRLAL